MSHLFRFISAVRMHVRIACVFACLFVLVAPVRAEPVQIRYLCGADEQTLKIVRQLVKEFESKHPNIRVRLEPATNDFSDTKALLMLAANIAPDVMNVGPGNLGQFSERGVLTPLSDFPDFNSPEVAPEKRYPRVMRALTRNGKVYALPRDVNTTGILIYNKRLFREAGIPYPDGSWTWDTRVRPELREKDFIWTMQKLCQWERGKPRPKVYALSTSWPQLWMETLLSSSGVKMWDSNQQPTKLFLQNPEVVRVFQFAADCINKEHWMPSNSDVAQGAGTVPDRFIRGEFAMLQTGTWDLFDLRKKMKDDWDIVPFPRYANSKVRVVRGEATSLCIFKSSAHPREAWEWVKFAAGRRAMTLFAQAGKGQPAFRDLSLQPGVWLPAAGASGNAAKPANLAITDELIMELEVLNLPEYFRANVGNSMQGTFYNVLTGGETAEHALQTLQRNSQPQLDAALRRVDLPPFPIVPAAILSALLVGALLAWIYLPERKRRLSNSERQENRSAYLFLIPWIIGILWTLGPMLFSLFMSFAEYDVITAPKWRGLGNYADLFNVRVDDTIPVSLRQTFLLAAISIPTGLVAAISLALLLNTKVKGVPIFRALYYIPSLASGVVMALLWLKVFDKDQGLLNSVLYDFNGGQGLFGLGEAFSRWVGIPGERIAWVNNKVTVIPAFVLMGLWGAGGGTIIFLAGLQGISQTYYEAATLDGANTWRKFRQVTLPLLSPTIFFSLLTGVIGVLQYFSQALVMTDGGPDRATLFYAIALYKRAFGDLKMGYASAMAWILFVIILVITVAQLNLSKRWVYYEGDSR